jgi:60 kDa SS-A/Ro ribonucleoprotein
VDVAALVAACVLRKTPRAIVLPFETGVVDVKLTARDSIMTNAEKLAAVGGGGTNCSAPLAKLNRDRVDVDVVIYVSDNESWVDPSRRGATATQAEFAQLKKRVPGAKLVAIDLVPNATAQARSSADVLNIGGFSDNVFELVAGFVSGALNAEGLVGAIEKVKL